MDASSYSQPDTQMHNPNGEAILTSVNPALLGLPPQPHPSLVSEAPSEAAGPSKPKLKPRPKQTERVLGQTLLPLARVQKIMKADKELAGTGKDAVFLISVATEMFIQRLAKAGHVNASREHRTTVMHKDMALAVKRTDEFTFLEEIIPAPIPASVALAKRRAKEKEIPSLDSEPQPQPQSVAPIFQAFERNKKGKGKADVPYTNGGSKDMETGDDSGVEGLAAHTGQFHIQDGFTGYSNSNRNRNPSAVATTASHNGFVYRAEYPDAMDLS